jgi:DNA-binding transcriptional ArsR family regulator
MRGRAIGGKLVELDQEIPTGTAVEVTPVPASGEQLDAVEQHLRKLEAEGAIERAGEEERRERRFEPILAVPGAVAEFLAERR